MHIYLKIFLTSLGFMIMLMPFIKASSAIYLFIGLCIGLFIQHALANRYQKMPANIALPLPATDQNVKTYAITAGSKSSRGYLSLRLKIQISKGSLTTITKKITKPLIFLVVCTSALAPFYLNNYWLDVFITAGIYCLLTLGLNIIVGFAGLLHLGYAAFFAIGAYSYALLNTHFALNFWLALPICSAIAGLAGGLLAIPALRLKGDYLAIVTLGFAEIVRIVITSWHTLTNGPNGISGIQPPILFSYSFHKAEIFYWILLLVIIFSMIVIKRIQHSRFGRAWAAVRDDEIAASAFGINVFFYKLYAMGLGSIWAGIAGVFFAAKMGFVSPESFTFMESVLIISMVILGGLGNVYGAVLGSMILVVLPEIMRGLQDYRMMMLGIGLVLIMRFMPHGILGKDS